MTTLYVLGSIIEVGAKVAVDVAYVVGAALGVLFLFGGWGESARGWRR